MVGDAVGVLEDLGLIIRVQLGGVPEKLSLHEVLNVVDNESRVGRSGTVIETLSVGLSLESTLLLVFFADSYEFFIG